MPCRAAICVTCFNKLKASDARASTTQPSETKKSSFRPGSRVVERIKLSSTPSVSTLLTLVCTSIWRTRFRTLFTNYIEKEGFDEGLKEATRNEMVKMISELRELTSEQRELLYAELGTDAEPLRSLIDNA